MEAVKCKYNLNASPEGHQYTIEKCGYGIIELGTTLNVCMCVRVWECPGVTEWKRIEALQNKGKKALYLRPAAGKKNN